MVGILEQAQGTPPATQPPAPQVPGAAPPETPGEITPEIQEALDMFMSNGLNIIHDTKMEGIIKNAANSEDPITGIADATLMVVSRLEGGMEKAGMDLPLEYIAQAASAFMQDIIEIAVSFGMEPFDEEESYAVYSIVLSKYLDQAVKSGKITPDQLQAMSEEVQATPEGQKIAQAGPQGAPPATGRQPAPGIPPTGGA